MNQEKSGAASPFAALSYQEQQDRWLEWRSRQLDYQSAAPEAPAPPAAPPASPAPSTPPLTLPFARPAQPTRHRELDRVLARHTQAAQRTGHFTATSPASAESGRSPAGG